MTYLILGRVCAFSDELYPLIINQYCLSPNQIKSFKIRKLLVRATRDVINLTLYDLIPIDESK